MLAMILGMIALGLVVFTVVALTFTWVLKKIKSKKTLRDVKKTMIADIQGLANACSNVFTLDQLDQLASKGITQVMADFDAAGNIIGDIEAIKDINQQLDSEVDKLLGREKMVVVEI